VLLVLLASLAAELALRVSDALAGRDASFYLPSQDLSQGLYAPHPYLGVVMRSGDRRPGRYQMHVNAFGMRGPETTREKPEGTWRVLCIGSSTTLGTGATRDDRTYPARLQELLQRAVGLGRAPEGRRYEVLNGGVYGYNTAESLINLELRLLELHPDAVLVYDAANDGRVIQMHGFQPDFSHARRPPPILEISALERFLLGHVRTYARLARGTDPEQQIGTLANWLFVPGFEKLSIPAAQWINEYGLSVYRRNLRNICAVTRAAGAEPLLQTYAVRGSDTPQARDMAPFIERANETMHELGAELGVSVAPVAEELTGKAELYDDWIHFNDDGELRHAQVVAQFAMAHGLLGLR
jgi:lysophospholipase L1-like esterase